MPETTTSATNQDILAAFTLLARYALGIVESKTQTLNTLQATYDALHKSYEDLQVQFANAPTTASNAADKQKIADLQTTIDNTNAALQDAKNQKDVLAAADAEQEKALLAQFNAFKTAITPSGVAPVTPIVPPTPGEVVPPIDTTPVILPLVDTTVPGTNFSGNIPGTSGNTVTPTPVTPVETSPVPVTTPATQVSPVAPVVPDTLFI